MALDEFGIAETVAVGVPAKGGESLSAPPGGRGRGRTLHRYGPKVRILGGGRSSGVFGSAPRSDSDSTAIVHSHFGLTTTERLGLDAFEARIMQDVALPNRTRGGESWDFVSSDAIGGMPDPVRTARAAAILARSRTAAVRSDPAFPLSARMRGRVAITLVIVGGPGRLAFSDAETRTVVAGVQRGLSWLSSLSPSRGLTWVHDIRPVTVATSAAYPVGDYEAMERPWRDAALATLGETAGLQGVTRWARRQRRRLATDWSYVAFFTKYPVAHFAYASLSGPRLVMHYDNDGWGPQNIDRVFAHESCHIFGAPDEYRASGCDCGGQWGLAKAPNLNCERCNPAPEPCIMRQNEWAMCASTRAHVGL